MFKLSIKSYLRSLIFIFSFIGVIAIFLFAGLSIFFNTFTSSTNSYFVTIKTSFDSTGADVQVFFNDFLNSLRSLDWSKPADALSTLLNKDWVNEHLIKALEAAHASVETLLPAIQEATNTLVHSIVVGVVDVVLSFMLGAFVSFLINKLLIDSFVKNNNIFKYVLSIIFDVLFQGILIVALVIIYFYWASGTYVILAVGGLISLMINLVEAKIVYGGSELKMKEVLNAKNVIMFAIANIIGYTLSGAILAVFATFINDIFAAVFCYSIFGVTYVAMSYAAKEYVCELKEKKFPAKKA